MKNKLQYDAYKQAEREKIGSKLRFRNPSKNTCKRIMRRAYFSSIEDSKMRRFNLKDSKNYFLYNWVGARLYIMSRGAICNRTPLGHGKYINKTGRI